MEPHTLQGSWTVGRVEPVELLGRSTARIATIRPLPSSPVLPDLPSHLTQGEKQQLQQVLLEYQDLFAQSEEDIGRTHLIEHHIQTDGGPVRVPYRRQNPHVREEEEKQIQQMLRQGVIRPSHSPWAAAVVMVRKKDGSLRFCIDYRGLNNVTVKDAHPLPRIDDTLESLHGSRYFSTLDLKAGYWQVPIQEADKHKTAFRTSSGRLYECEKLAFGLCNGPATFSRLMDTALTGLAWEVCLAYLDDVIVFSASWPEHLTRLRAVLDRLRRAGLKLNPKKCALGQTSVPFLGHVVSAEGIRPDPRLLQAIRDIPAPTCVKELRSYLGLVGYYRRFIPGFSKKAVLLHDLLHKDQPWTWTSDHQAVFQELKDKLLTQPVTAFPDFTRPFRLYTDASTIGLGAILAQVQDGKERIICCASRSTNASEKNYGATKLECLAIVWALKTFRHFLVGHTFEVLTDHYALQWLRTMKAESALLHRWREEVEEYDFVVKHRPGKLQTHVDALSRLPVGLPEQCSVIRVPEEVTAELQEWNERAQRGDAGHEEAVSIGGLSFNKQGRIMVGPKAARHLMMTLHHSTAGHIGSKKLLAKFRERYAANQDRGIAEEVTRECDSCQRGKDYGHKAIPQGNISSPGPWHTISVDIMGPFSTEHGKRFIVSFIDIFSKYVILTAEADHTAQTIARSLMQNVIAYFGVPAAVLSDRGREFVGEVWTRVQQLLGCEMFLTSPYHPQGNAVIERVHRTINNVIRATMLEDARLNWVDALPAVQLNINAAIHTSHQYSPYYVNFGRSARLPAEGQLPAPVPHPPLPQGDYVSQVEAALKACHQVVGTYMNRPSAPGPYLFKPDEEILVHAAPHEMPNKLAPKWRGPYRVINVPNRYQVEYEVGGRTRITHVNRAKKYIPSYYTGWAVQQRRSGEFDLVPEPTPASSGENRPRPVYGVVYPSSTPTGGVTSSTITPTLTPVELGEADNGENQDKAPPFSTPSEGGTDLTLPEREEPASGQEEEGDLTPGVVSDQGGGGGAAPLTPQEISASPSPEPHSSPTSNPSLTEGWTATPTSSTWTASDGETPVSTPTSDDLASRSPTPPSEATFASAEDSSGTSVEHEKTITTRTGRTSRPPERLGEWTCTVNTMEPHANNVRTLHAWIHGRWVNLAKDRHKKRLMLANYATHTPMIHYQLTIGTPGLAAIGHWAERIAPFSQWQLAPTGTVWTVTACGWGQPQEKGGSDVTPRTEPHRRSTPQGQRRSALAAQHHRSPSRTLRCRSRLGGSTSSDAQSPHAADLAGDKRRGQSQGELFWSSPGSTPSLRLALEGPCLPKQSLRQETPSHRQALEGPCLLKRGLRQEKQQSHRLAAEKGLRSSRPEKVLCSSQPASATGPLLHQNPVAAEEKNNLTKVQPKDERINRIAVQPEEEEYVPAGGRPAAPYCPGADYVVRVLNLQGREPIQPRPPRQEWSPSRPPVDPRVTVALSPPPPDLTPHRRWLFSPVFSPCRPSPEKPDRGPLVGLEAARQLIF